MQALFEDAITGTDLENAFCRMFRSEALRAARRISHRLPRCLLEHGRQAEFAFGSGVPDMVVLVAPRRLARLPLDSNCFPLELA